MQTESTTKTSPTWGVSLLITLLLAAVGVGAGYFYAESQPKSWKATAVFSAPQPADLGNYFALYSTYQLVQQDGKSDPNLEKIVAEESYKAFQSALAAADKRKQFLTDNAIIKQIADANYLPLNDKVNALLPQLHFDPQTHTLSLNLVNPEQAVKVLEQYIAFIQGQVRTQLNNDLVSKWRFLFQNVKQSAEANLGESWQGKLNLMRSVQPLDNQLIPFRLEQKPTAEIKPLLPPYWYETLGIGGAIGLLLGCLIGFIRRR